MNKIFKSTMMLVLGLGLFTACSDDNDSNPSVQAPTKFVLNTPAAANTEIDLAYSDAVVLTCSQPDYGFPAYTNYTVQVALTEDMADYVTLSEAYNSAKISIDAATLAATLTTMLTDKGKTDADFPMNIPVYFRLRAVMTTTMNDEIPDTEILSNVVSYNNVHLLYSLPPPSS